MRLIQRIFSYFIAFIMIFSSMTAPYVSNVTNTTVYAEEVSSTEEMVTAEDKAVRQGRDEIYDENYTLPQWNHNLLNLGAARQEGLTGAGVSVAVLDTGFYADHPDIQFAGGASLFDDDSWTNDHTGHGTHVAGIIGALAGSAHPGVAPDVSLYGIKVYHQDEVDENGQPLTDIDNIADGIRMAVDMGVHIILISSGAGIDSEALHAAVTYAQNAGVLIVAAAGNGQSFVDYPAAYPEVVAVSSIDANLNPAGDIIYGAENEIAAPGVNITSLSTPDSPYGYPYVAMSGSSQAAPHVAGLAALLMQKYGANAALVREKLHEGAYDLGNENLYGYGLAGFLSEGVMKKAEPEPEAPDSNEDEDQEDDEATSSSSKKDDTTKEQKKKDQQAKKQKENSERRFKRAYREKDADVASYEDSRERKTRHTYITVVPTFKKRNRNFRY